MEAQEAHRHRTQESAGFVPQEASRHFPSGSGESLFGVFSIAYQKNMECETGFPNRDFLERIRWLRDSDFGESLDPSAEFTDFVVAECRLHNVRSGENRIGRYRSKQLFNYVHATRHISTILHSMSSAETSKPPSVPPRE